MSYRRGGSFQSRGGPRKYHSEHDDRGGGGSDQRSGGRGGSWRGNSRGGRWTRGGRGGGPRRGGGRNQYSNYDDDVDMERGGGGHDRQYNRYKPYDDHRSPPSKGGSVFGRLGDRGGGGRGKDRGDSVFDRLSGGMGGGSSGSSSGWHKITVIGGGNNSNDWVIQQLQSSITEPFRPVQIHVRGDKLMFFVEEPRAAEQMRELKSIQSRSGPLPVSVKQCPPPHGGEGDGGGGRGGSSSGGPMRRKEGFGGGRAPFKRKDSDVTMEEDSAAVLLHVMGERFNTENNSLDLSNMFYDRTLQEHGIRGSMFDTVFVNTVLELINQHCPRLVALDLSKNKLQRLEQYHSLGAKCPNLQILILADNELRSVQELEQFGTMNSVTSLSLRNNPFLQHDQDFASYAGNVRKIFPNLQLLDDQQLPSPVKFDLPVHTGSLPPTQKGFLLNDEVQKLVISFLEQYYQMYDDDTRENLLEAYGQNAVFSLAVSPPQTRGPPLTRYLHQSRNLKAEQVKDTAKRQQLLKHGRIDIVQCLRDLPKTYHHSSSFSVDVLQATRMSTTFSVYGMFSEVTPGSSPDSFPVRAFTRTFVIMATGTGSVAIINDQLMIRNAKHQSVKAAHEELSQLSQFQVSQQQSLSSASSSFPTNPFNTGAAPPIVMSSLSTPILASSSSADDIAIKLSADSGMNIEWSKKCLLENGWDYQKALLSFQMLQSQGQVPAAAFQRPL